MNIQYLQILFFILISLSDLRCQDEDIQQLDHSNFKLEQYYSDTTSIKNKTYQMDQSIFNKQHKSFFLELELDIDKQQQDEIQILFALSQLISLQLNSKTKNFEADFIDKRGYYMRKKYYRIEFETSYLIDENPIYLTIYQNTQDLQNINYRIKLGVQDNGKQQSCPFNCLSSVSQGVCNKNNGICQCYQGYFDTDCSRESYDLSLYSEESETSPYYFTWKQSFSQQKKSGFYYNISPNQSGYLYLKIKKKDPVQKSNITKTYQNNQIGNLLIYYTSDPLNYESFEVADENYSKISFQLTQQQLMSEQELYLEYFSLKKKNLINNTDINSNSENNNSQISANKYNLTSLNQDQLFLQIGFRQEGIFLNSSEIIEYEITFYMKLEGPDNFNNNSQEESNKIVIAMSIVLGLLTITLIILVFYLHKKTQVINQAISAINVRKSKKEKENNLILELIPVVKYTEEYKKSVSTASQLDEDLSCSVCLCEFEINEDIKKTYCPHYFHIECLQQWLIKQKNCPHCRNILTPKTLKDRNEKPQKYFQSNAQNQQVQKSIKQNKDYIQQIDDLSIDISKTSKKSNSPNKSPRKSQSTKRIPSQKSISPQKSPQKNKQNDVDIMIMPKKSNSEKKTFQKFQSLFNFSDQNNSNKNQNNKKVEIIELQTENPFQTKPETNKINFKEQVLLHDISQITEQLTLHGDRTTSNQKNRFSILSTGTPSNFESHNQFNFNNIRKNSTGKRISNSQIIEKQKLSIDIEEIDQ